MAKNPDRNAERQFEIPSELRAFTEKSVEQAKQAFDGFISAAHRTMSEFEGQAASAHQDAQKLGDREIKGHTNFLDRHKHPFRERF